MDRKAMEALWEKHIKAEFVDHDVDATLATMTEDAFVRNMPVGTGGSGKAGVREFYNGFVPSTEGHRMTLSKRTVGDDALVDKLHYGFVHDRRADWLAPGVPPTGHTIELDIVAVVLFRDGKIAGERIYWDHASVLRQMGLLRSDVGAAG